MIRIVVADDHVLVRQGIARALADAEGFQVVGEAGNAEQALELVAQQSPDIVLMDISMPGTSGLVAAETLRKTYPQIKVLMLTVHDKEDYLFKAFRAGASGYVLKEASLEELAEAVKTVALGEVYVYPGMAYKVVKDYLRRSQNRASKADTLDTLKALTSREEEILSLVAEGHRSKDIAQSLNLSLHTVNNHLDHIRRKLNLHSKAGLIHFALRHGLIDELE